MSLNTIKTYYINFTAKNKVERDIGDLGTIITSTHRRGNKETVYSLLYKKYKTSCV
jgi:hypothetical protein